MTPAISRQRASWFAFTLVGITGLLFLAGFWDLFTTFKFHDDEGYVLLSLRNFSGSGKLYTEVYSQYGPFFFLFYDAFHRLTGLDFTHNVSRGVTLFYWTGAAVLSGLIVRRQLRPALGWPLFALAGTFAHLREMTQEPMHPGGLITFVLALAAWSGAQAVENERTRRLALIVGIAGTVLAFTKINVGVLFFAATGAWLLLHAAAGVWEPTLRWLTGIALVAIPIVLMRPLLDEEWVRTFAWNVVAAVIGVLLALRPTLRTWFAWRGWIWLGAGAGSIVVVVPALVWCRGTSLNSLLDGVLFAPLRHPAVFSLPILWLPATRVIAALSLGLGVFTALRGCRAQAWFRLGIAWLRGAIVAVAAATWLHLLPVDPAVFAMSYGLPLLWVFVVPLASDVEALAACRVRTWLALLVVLQSMHAYPVGGSQESWGTFLWVPLITLGAAEAGEILLASAKPIIAVLAGTLAGATAAVAAIGPGQRWFTGEALRLPGAEMLRLQGSISALLRVISANAAVHSDTLFSVPGVFSFNLWTGRPTPTPVNVTTWFLLLSEAQQTEIIARLRDDPRSGIVVDQFSLDLVRVARHPPHGLLYDYIQAQFAPAFAVGNHEFWIKRGRTIAPLSVAQLYHRAPGATGAEWRLEVCLAVPAGSAVATAEWIEYEADGRSRTAVRLTTADCQLEVTPLFSNGRDAGVPRTTTLPASVSPLSRLVFITDEPLGTFSRRAVLRLHDPAGGVIGEAVFAR